MFRLVYFVNNDINDGFFFSLVWTQQRSGKLCVANASQLSEVRTINKSFVYVCKRRIVISIHLPRLLPQCRPCAANTFHVFVFIYILYSMATTCVWETMLWCFNLFDFSIKTSIENSVMVFFLFIVWLKLIIQRVWLRFCDRLYSFKLERQWRDNGANTMCEYSYCLFSYCVNTEYIFNISRLIYQMFVLIVRFLW